MQPQPPIYQPQIIVQNPQLVIPNPYVQNQQLYQVIQTESPNLCEKCSRFFTGSTNIPLAVFIILMTSFAYHFHCVLFNYSFLTSYYIMASFFDFIFAIFVWSKMAIKIEKITSTVKYGYLYLINLIILSFITFTFPFERVWNFVLLETILIALNNKNKNIKFFCCRISGKMLIILSIIYHILFNSLNIVSILITIGYAFIYRRYLIYKLNISNQAIQRMEFWFIISCFKNRFKTFISIQDVLDQEKQSQPLAQDINNNININNSVNNSFVPNMYPNYNSEINQNIPDQSEVQKGSSIQQYPPQAQPVIDINQIS